MCKVILVKNELEALRYDVHLALVAGNDPEQLLIMAMTKIDNLFKMDKKEYLNVRWKR
jgi:hypothetical protein